MTNFPEIKEQIAQAREFAERVHCVYGKETVASMGAQWTKHLAGMLEAFVDSIDEHYPDSAYNVQRSQHASLPN